MRLSLFFVAFVTLYSSNSQAMCFPCCDSDEEAAPILEKNQNHIIIQRHERAWHTIHKDKNCFDWTCTIKDNPTNCIEIADEGVADFTDFSHTDRTWRIKSTKPGAAVLKLKRTKKNKIVEEQLIYVTVKD